MFKSEKIIIFKSSCWEPFYLIKFSVLQTEDVDSQILLGSVYFSAALCRQLSHQSNSLLFVGSAFSAALFQDSFGMLLLCCHIFCTVLHFQEIISFVFQTYWKKQTYLGIKKPKISLYQGFRPN